MRRPFVTLLPLLLLQCLDGSTEGTTQPIRGGPITIASAPIALDGEWAGRERLGALRLLGAWQLTSSARGFGGLSAIDVHNGRITTLSDIGAIIRFRIGRFGNVSEARIDPLPPGCDAFSNRNAGDSEALAHNGVRSQWWIGFEWRNAICRTSGDFARGEALARPAAMRAWKRRRGPESMLRLIGGRFLVIEEGAQEAGSRHDALVFDGDPADPAARALRFGFQPPDGYAPTDAAQLPDGRLLILTRRFTVWSLFTSKLVLVDRLPDQPNATFSGRVIATFAPPVVADNFEGLAVSVEDGRPILWMLSDDNYMRWQRTLLLKFALN